MSEGEINKIVLKSSGSVAKLKHSKKKSPNMKENINLQEP